MADIAVNHAIDKLFTMLTNEASLPASVQREVREIKDELESIQSFLRDADARADREKNNYSLRTWLKQVREASYQIEDVIDEYTVQVAQPPHLQDGFFRKIARMFGKLMKRLDIVSRIQYIKASVQELKQRSERYHFDSSEQESNSGTDKFTWHGPRVASLFIREDEVVGIESARDELIRWLAATDSSRMVISVVGMGGLGKTTLAKKVYDSQTKSCYFDCYAWITVSQTYKMEDLLRTMIKEFLSSRKERAPEENINKMEKLMLIIKLREYLQEKRYVVVFDDVWEVNFWGSMEHALLDNDKGSRIIITTRNKEVADSPKTSSTTRIHNLQPLPQDRSWELFCKRAFRHDSGARCPQELEELSRGIVRRCEGLPLAIVVIGGLLSTKDKTVSNWKSLHDNLGVELESNPHLASIKKILTLSYHDLPYHLKSCFLYLAMFPEDYYVSCMRLVRLWIAEGFVKEKRGKTIEEISEGYLTELIQRSLVQVSWVDYFGKARTLRVHDLMREIILSKSEDELGFCHVFSEDNATFNDVTRRLSIHKSMINHVVESMLRLSSHIRSAAFLLKLPEPFMVKTFIKNFELLRVLDFQDARIDHVPEEVGNLFHLRYLSLRKTKVTELPESMGKLHNLETLDLKRTHVHKLPFEINGLSKLRHLLAFFFEANIDYSTNSFVGLRIRGGVGCLKALQKLSFVESDHGGVLVRELEQLTQLRKLGITKLTRENGTVLCSSVEKMKHLRSLELLAVSEDEIIDFSSLSSPPQSLQRLILRGRLEMLPDWIPTLQNLVRLNLYWSGLTNNPLGVLGSLPSLVDLGIDEAYDGEQLHFEAGGFQKLKDLWLVALHQLNRMEIDDGALPSLERLVIGSSPQLREVPSGIHSLRNLTTLSFNDLSKEFVRRMLPEGGQDYCKVKHIPKVLLKCKLHGERYHTYRLGDSKMLEYFQN